MLARGQLHVHLGVLNMKQLHLYQKSVCCFGSAVLMYFAVAVPFLHRPYLCPGLCTVPLSFTEKDTVGRPVCPFTLFYEALSIRLVVIFFGLSLYLFWYILVFLFYSHSPIKNNSIGCCDCLQCFIC